MSPIKRSRWLSSWIMGPRDRVHTLVTVTLAPSGQLSPFRGLVRPWCDEGGHGSGAKLRLVTTLYCITQPLSPCHLQSAPGPLAYGPHLTTPPLIGTGLRDEAETLGCCLQLLSNWMRTGTRPRLIGVERIYANMWIKYSSVRVFLPIKQLQFIVTQNNNTGSIADHSTL